VAAGRGVIEGPGISIKLSALHPRYQRAQHDRVRDELYPRLLALAEQAFRHGVGFNLDAEEAERLDISLDLLERLCLEPALAGWDGIGFVVQAYQKRCPQVIDYLVDLARRSGHRLMLRLVKGAYWDSEIKRAQVLGLDDYPVFTRKAHTDVCYLACARRMLAAPDALYAQFATHNAHTLAAVHRLAGSCVRAPTAAWAVRAASTPRSAAMRPCSPTSSADCWRTGRIPPSYIVLKTRRSRSTRCWPNLSTSSTTWPAARGGRDCPIRASRFRGNCTGPSARIPPAST
jgi:hypothetical protein